MRIQQLGCAPANFRRGRLSHLPISAVVIHIIDGSQTAADATFLSTALTDRRSAHYSIGRNGEVHQYVDEADTAFHCGVIDRPTWSGLEKSPTGSFINPNFYTIGIEHEGRAHDEWPDEMYAASAELLRDISLRYPALQPLTRQNVVMHREIRASKSCPGFKVDMDRLIVAARAGITGAGTATDPVAVRTLSNVNVRTGRPSTSAPIARIIPAGEIVNVRGFVSGETVRGISRWFQTMDDDFIWAGAVEVLPLV